MKINNVLLAAFMLMFSSFTAKSEQETMDYDEMPSQEMQDEGGDASQMMPEEEMPIEEMPPEEVSADEMTAEEMSQAQEEMPADEMMEEMPIEEAK